MRQPPMTLRILTPPAYGQVTRPVFRVNILGEGGGERKVRQRHSTPLRPKNLRGNQLKPGSSVEVPSFKCLRFHLNPFIFCDVFVVQLDKMKPGRNLRDGTGTQADSGGL